MKTYIELKLFGSSIEQEKLIKLIEKQLSNGWVRDRKREISRTGVGFVWFTYSEAKSRPSVGLAFTSHKDGYLWLCNIVSLESKSLNIDQYNSTLKEFLTCFIEPAAKALEIEVRKNPCELTIDNAMSPELAKLLRTFSDSGNKTGLHPLDEKRFFDFIIKAHQEKSLLHESVLGELLVESGWPDDQALELSCNYRFGKDLLTYCNG